jgi:predicted acylesterase/phospholipase RssA
MPDPLGGASGNPTECDLVMKGGITSGVIYPLAAVELAKRYRFRSIGGASAGAIAAALTAAAELGRQRGRASFAELETVARGLGARLRGLFQPSPRLAGLFDVLFAAVARRGPAGKVAGVVAALARAYRSWTLLALLPPAALATYALLRWNAFAAIAAALLLGLLLTAVWAWRLGRDLLRSLPAHDYGLCTGRTQPGAAGPALTDWLTDLLDDLAGVERGDAGERGRPLTFGDLETAGIELRAMTTCLTLGRPYSLPFESRAFRFRADEMRRLFPERVVDWMARPRVESAADAAPLPESSDEAPPAPEERSGTDREAGFLPLPTASDLPVVVAVRMSLSFPLLFAAVKLWARDYTREAYTARQTLRPVWFSDGGICSNFPIHFFDATWPTRPTFGITLEELGAADEPRVYFPTSAAQGILRAFRRVSGTGSFLGAIFGTMRTWQDDLQSTLPGYRERIVHVALDESEGGLNLDMDPRTITELTDYGAAAGLYLRDDFDWAAHRWTRALSATRELADALDGIDRVPADVGSPEEFVAARDVAERPYAQSKSWQQDAVELLAAWSATGTDAAAVLDGGRFPRPRPRLRMAPRV